MIHELRIYHCLPNRLPALLNRFTLADITTGRPVIRPIGTNGQADSDPGPVVPTATVAPRNLRTPPPR